MFAFVICAIMFCGIICGAKLFDLVCRYNGKDPVGKMLDVVDMNDVPRRVRRK